MEENSLMHAKYDDNHDMIDEANPVDFIDEAIVEAIWSDLDGRIDREQVLETALAVARDFTDASVTTFIPLFIRRRTYERLKLLVE